MKKLLSEGYYNFSDCDFQPMMPVDKYKFDEGKSMPYFVKAHSYSFTHQTMFSVALQILIEQKHRLSLEMKKMIYLICQMKNFDRLSMNWKILRCFA